ncbi:MAG: hypothetical protein ACYTG5_21375, partial [Planctomycetota bacterium]
TETVATLDVKVESFEAEKIVSVYEPKHVDSLTLSQLATQLLGRQIQTATGGWQNNISTAGTSIVINDTAEDAGVILTKLEALDEAFARSAESSPVSQYQTLEYRPRALSLNAVYSALQPFYRTISPAAAPYSSHGMGQVQNIAMVHEQGQLVVRDTAAQIEAIKTLLERIDKPAPQVVISAYVLSGRDTEDGNAPEELAEALRALLPYSSYQIEAAGVLRSSTSPQKHFNLTMRGSARAADNLATTYQLQASITAYDEDQQSLTFDNLNFSGSGPDLNGQLFNTSTTIFGGEYAVLGVSGGKPIFAVLRMQPVRPKGEKKSN